MHFVTRAGRQSFGSEQERRRRLTRLWPCPCCGELTSLEHVLIPSGWCYPCAQLEACALAFTGFFARLAGATLLNEVWDGPIVDYVDEEGRSYWEG